MNGQITDITMAGNDRGEDKGGRMLQLIAANNHKNCTLKTLISKLLPMAKLAKVFYCKLLQFSISVINWLLENVDTYSHNLYTVRNANLF